MSTPAPTLSWLFFSFKGRIARRSFIFSILFLLLPQILIVVQMVRNEGNPGALTGLVLIMFCLWACTLWSLFAITTKRLPDLGVTGALSLLAFFPAVSWIFFLALSILPSSSQTNEYGPPPFAD